MKRIILSAPFILLVSLSLLLPTLSRSVSCEERDGEGGQAIFPKTPAGRSAAGWLEAFNSGDAGVMNRFYLDHASDALLARRSEEERMNMYLNVYGQTGSITLHRILLEKPDRMSFLVRSEKGEWLETSLRFGEGSGKLDGIMFRPSAPPDDLPQGGPINESEAFDGIREKLLESTRNDEFAGTVLIARNGKPVFTEAFGMASREFSVSNTVDTRYNLGSINKIFTKTAIAILLSEGRLSLDDRIGDHLPDYPNREAAERVTIRHLIEMTSGIGDFFGERYVATPKSQIRTLEDYLPLFAGEPLEFEPGTDNRYSNGGYVVLGLIVESVSGESYFDFVRERIFEPSGMENTDSYEADMIVGNLASGYTRSGLGRGEGDLRSNIYSRPAKGSSAGGGYSTVSDLLGFVNALQSNSLLAPEYSAWILGGPEPGREDVNDDDSRRGGVAWAGGAPGINSFLEVGAEGDYTVVVMTNLDPPAAMKVGGLIRSWLNRIE